LATNPYDSPVPVTEAEFDSGADDPLGAAPSLWSDRAFLGLTSTQFLGAFNDNLFKQVLLLLFVAVPIAGSDETRDLQWLGTLFFSVPFILFSGFAGFLSDRNSKRRVIVASKGAEVVIMLAGAGLFALYAATGLSPLLIGLLTATLFCMGAQSAFFGPGKYGILPELFRRRDLPGANGVILMTTFLAIILGTALAGWMLESFPGKLWATGLTCTAIAFVGTATSLTIRPTPIAQPHLPFDVSVLTIPHEIRRLLKRDRPLFAALAASIVFWMAASMVMMAVNALGMNQLGVGEKRTSVMVALISVGIAAGSVIAGAASRGRFNTTVLKTGLWGMAASLLLLALPGPDGSHLLGYWGSIPALIAAGLFCGMFAVPLQVFLQSRPPKTEKGRMIATQNLLNWIGIMFSAGIYWAVNQVLASMNGPPSGTFAFTAALLAITGVLYRPREERLAASSASRR
jgi:MFS family permease